MSAPQHSSSDQSHWHLDKKVSVSHILTTFALAISLFAWGAAMDKRVTVLEENRKVQAQLDIRQDEVLKQALVELRSSLKDQKDELREMNNKLDRLIEKRSLR